MLKELYIKNLAVISEATIDFTDSFNVFTGETGAGKSILINGINAVLGQRVSKDLVRTGSDKAVITALFTDISDKVKAKLEELGISYENDEILVTREISPDGKSTARVNSRVQTVSVIKEIGETLVNIHGQHDNQQLLNPEKHIEILDGFGELEPMIEDYHNSFINLQNISRKLKKLKEEEKARLGEIDKIKTTIKEISAVDPDENEDEILENEYKKAINIFDISSALSGAYKAIDGDEETAGLIESFDEIIDSLTPLSDMVEIIPDIVTRLKNVRLEMSDISSELIRENDGIEFNEGKIKEISDRLDLINGLKKKYGPSLSDVMEKYQKAKEESEKSELSDEEIKEVSKERERLLSEVTMKARKLSNSRKEAADRFTEKIENELDFLDMSGVKLSVSIINGKLTGNGMDTVEFLISTNKGEDLKPLAKIASGGELSRIMLALKSVIADKDDIHTLIFDEIDTGVSGRAAQKIGRKLLEVSQNKQVLCVTHLAQIASMADNHLLIEKKTEGDRTFTRVKTLCYDERKYEIARITVGDNITDTALKNAEEMLNFKNN